MNNLNVYVIGGSVYYAEFLQDYNIVKSIDDADIVILTGGEDVTPDLYGESQHRTTFNNLNRDLYEIDQLKMVRNNQLVVGICRGSQLSCVVNGGKLVQNCHNHCGLHDIRDTKTNEVFRITSTHHQMQYPYNLPKEDYTVMFVASPTRSDIWEGTGIDTNIIREKGEPEIVLYHKKNRPRFLAIQGHPEMIPESPISNEINKIIRKIL